MSLSSDGNQGYLDIRNAILRVGTLDVYGITGVDQVTNVVKQNSVLIWDDQGSDMTTPPFQKGAGVARSTSPPEINLVDSEGNNFMYQGLKLPNSWQGEFDLYFADATAGAINCHFYTTSTTSYADDGYELAFDRENSTITLRYDAAQVAQATGVTLSTQWHTASVTFNRGAWAVSIDGERVLTHDDDERSAVYDNTTGQYVRFETAATTDRKVRYIKFLNNGASWLESNAGHLYNLSSNVAIGVSEDDYRFSVAGTANLGATTVTSIAVGDDTDSTSTSTGALTVQGLGVASNLHATNVYATNVFVGTHAGVDAYDFSVHGTANTGVLTATSIVVGDETEATSVSTGALQTFALGVESNIHTNNLYSDHANTQTLEVNETVTVNANVYAKGLHLAQVASNLVTWDSTTGDLMDSGGLISNKLAIVSEQPPAALTGDSTVVDGHGRYKVTTSLEATTGYEGYKAFDKTIGQGTDGWSSGASGAYNSDGTYAGSNTLASVNGEWVKLELPYKATLRHVALASRDASSYAAMPEDFSIVASNDDSTWVVLKSVDGQSWSSTDYVNFIVDASTAYKYYAIVVELTNNNFAQIGEWKLFTETFTVDAGVVSTTAASGLDVGYTEHPVEAFTGSTTYNANIGSRGEFQPSTHYVEGHGTYEAWASTQYNASGQDTREVWKLFDTGYDYWGSALTGTFETYNSSSPYEYVGTRDTTTTDVGGTRYKGVFVQLKMPYAITLAYTDIYRTIIGANNPNRAPGAGVFFGSNDGEHWYKLTEFSGASYASDDKERITLNATTPYQYYRFVITNIVGGNSQTSTLFSQWRLFAEKPVTRMENVHISGDLSSETLQTGYIKWPRKNLKANESEGYVASASNVYNTSVSAAPYTAFNNYREIKENGYADAFVGGNGDFTAGVANKSRTTGDDTFNHEWLQIQMPRAIKLSHFTLLQRVKNVDNDNDMPKNGRMYGSNDGVSWTKLVTFSNLTYERYEETRVDVKSTTPYSYYRLAVTETVGSSQVYVAVGELQLFEAATGVGAAPTSAKLQVAGSLGMAKGSEFFAGDDVVMELPKHDRPLVKYPEVAMTTSQDVTTLTYEGYTVSASNDRGSSYRPWKAFDGLREDAGGWGTGNYYDVSTGAAKNTSTQFEGNYGEYLELQLPVMIKLEKVVIKPRDVDASKVPEDAPGSGYIYASNDGSDWTLLHSFSGLSYGGASSDGDATNETLQVNASHAYKYYRLQATSRSGQNGTDEYVNIAELEYWGYEEGDTSVDVVHRSIPNKPGQQHLEVYWDANDSNSYSFADSSNVYDLSGSGVTGTITGNNGFDAEYNAWVFDGSGDYISGTQGLGTGQPVHSQSVWFKMNANTGDYQYICMIGTNSTDDQSAITLNSDDEIRFEMYGTPTALTTDTKVVADAWYHVVAVYTGGNWNNTNCSLYVNGVKVVLNNGSNTTTSPTITGDLVRLGSTGSQWELNGSIANFRLFSKALNADQVRELYEYDAPRFGHRQNLVSLHKGNLGVGVAHPTSRFEVAGADGLQEYPPKAMTGYDTYMEGHGVFRASASSEYSSNYPSWKAFNKLGYSGVDGWSSGQYTVLTASGLPDTGNCAVFDNIYCNWLQLETPYQILLKTIQLELRNTGNAPEEMPKDGRIYGSVDGANWVLINSFNNLNYGGSTGSLRPFVEINANIPYKIFRLVITSNYLPLTSYTDVGELRYFGTPAPSSLEDGHLTLGKALTLPRVSGHPAGAETPRAESLVVHYDTTVDSVVSGTTVVDISGEGNNGTLNNGAAYSSTDRAFTFDGVNDYVSGTLNNPAGAWVHSFSFWVKLTGTSVSNESMFSIGTDASDKTSTFKFETSTSLNWFFYGNDIKFNPQAQLNTWEHYVCVYDGGNVASSRRVWKNGVELSRTLAVVFDYLNLDSNASFRVANRSNLSQPAQCSISNFKLYDVALTAEEVAMEYALGRTGKSLNLTDTALCLGGTVPRAQLDVRGTVWGSAARFGGDEVNIADWGTTDSAVSISTTDSTLPLSVHRGTTSDDVPAIRIAVQNSLSSTIGDYWRAIDFNTEDFRQCGINLINYNYSGTGQFNLGGRRRTGIGFSVSASDGTNVLENAMVVRESGNVGIGVTNPGGTLTIQQTSGSYASGTGLRFLKNGNRWDLGIVSASDNNFAFAYNGSSRGYFRYNGSNTVQNFTGQHRTFIKNVPFSQAGDLEGLIVSSDQNKYIKMSGGIEAGSNAITTNESLPLVSLSTKVNDKKCFGVISASEDPETREDAYGNFVTPYEKELGDTRVYINSVGEGAMWVVNTAGALESGDYITTSNVAGYGQRQDDDILHNYTVAKITMDCDFNPSDIPVQRIVKELSNVTYWYQLEDATSNAHDRTVEETYYTKDRHVEVYGHVDEQSNVFVPPEHDVELYVKTQVNTVSEEVWAALPEDERVLYDANTFTYTQTIEIAPEVWDDLGVEEQNTYAHGYFNVVTDEVAVDTPGAVERTRTLYKKVVNDTKVEPETPEDYLSEVREEWVNVLDEHGQLQWEDVPWGDTEPAYKLRYLDAEGQITTRHNAVHIAAFVGVTYHCG
jgi:hypothetical protein